MRFAAISRLCSAAHSATAAFSGGRGKCCRSRALNGDPRLFLLDEPSDGVQPSIVQEIGSSPGFWWRGDRSGAVVEQNVELIRRWPSRLYVMDKGRIVASLDKATIATLRRWLSFLSI